MTYIVLLFSLVGCGFLLQGVIKPSPVLTTAKGVVIIVVVLFLELVPIYSLLLIFTQRPFFSISISAILLLAVFAVSNAKYSALREPLVFTDFYLYLQAFKYPRLYLPFLGVVPIVLLVSITGLVLFSGYYFEEAVFRIISSQTLLLLTSIPLSLIMLLNLSKVLDVTGDVLEDSRTYGAIVVLVLYVVKSVDNHRIMQKQVIQVSPFKFESNDSLKDESLADVVVIQSESFFDARLITPNVRKDILQEYDLLLSENSVSGRLHVPAWGANTMRTEFAFLTGIDPKMLGLAQYYPYRQLLKYNIPSVVSALKKQGYHCVCIHPHAASFFKRDKFFSNIGFDEFIDEGSFEGAERYGPYVADSAVKTKITNVCDYSDKPCFIFAITMENHGPLHLESVDEVDWGDYFYQKPSEGLDDLTAYLRHLRNADRMISDLNAYFMSREKDTLFGFYGDHVPAMSSVFHKLNYHDSHTNYFIWSTWNAKSVSEGGAVNLISDLAVQNLATELLATLNSRK